MTTAELEGDRDERVHVVLVSPGPSLLAELLEHMITRSEEFTAGQFAGPAVDVPASVDPPPDVLLVEVPATDAGCAFARTCRERWPSASLLLLVAEAGSWCSRLATEVDAAGWITCHHGADELISAIKVVARTGHLGRAASGRTTPARVRRSGQGFGLDPLTGRERQVLQLLSTACSLDDIAAQLGISANTVRTHVQNVITKLGVNSRVEAVLLAQRAGAINSRQVLDLREPASGKREVAHRPLHAQP